MKRSDFLKALVGFPVVGRLLPSEEADTAETEVCSRCNGRKHVVYDPEELTWVDFEALEDQKRFNDQIPSSYLPKSYGGPCPECRWEEYRNAFPQKEDYPPFAFYTSTGTIDLDEDFLAADPSNAFKEALRRHAHKMNQHLSEAVFRHFYGDG